MKRPALSKIASSLTTLVMKDAANGLYRLKAARKSEADDLGADLRHARDFLKRASERPQEALWLMEGVQVAPVAAIHSAARQIAEEGAE